jgi:hypothetical protein
MIEITDMAPITCSLYHHIWPHFGRPKKKDILHPQTCSGGSIQLTFCLSTGLGLALSVLFLGFVFCSPSPNCAAEAYTPLAFPGHSLARRWTV